jgi:polar amino acid transport system substrate-binding protein
MKKKTVLILTAVLVLAVGLLVGCGDKNKDNTAADTSWKYVQDNGTLIIGLDDTFAPMGFKDKKGKLVGFDIDFARAVGKKLGVKIKFQPINWNAKDANLKSKKIDCIWNGLSATPERAKSYSLSKEYLDNKLVVVTTDAGVKVESAADLANYKVGTQADSSALEAMKANKDYDKFKDNIKEYDSYDTAILDMKAGRIDCIVIDQVLATYKNTKLKEKLNECKYNFGSDYYVIGFRKGDKALTDKVNGAIKALIDDGTAAKISKEWFGKDIVIYKDYK